MPENLWSKEDATALSLLDELVYRSNLLGSDTTLVNYGGGNTSAKGRESDHAGREFEIMWIKGSGSDLGGMDHRGFTPLRLGEVRSARERDHMSDEEMVTYLSRCMVDPSAPRPSIETMLHAFLPFPHVDHTHPQAGIAMCCSRRGEELMRECFGDALVWVPYVRPGFALAKLALEALEGSPGAKGMLLAKHGLVTWGTTGRESYDRTIDILRSAETFLETQVDSKRVFGGPALVPASRAIRRQVMVELMPVIRGELSRLAGSDGRSILNWNDSEDVLDFVCGEAMPELANTGAACPDHVMYTKFQPLVIDREDCDVAASDGVAVGLVEAVRTAITGYVHRYTAFHESNRDGDAAMLNPGPRVILIPGFGMITVGRDAWAAKNTASLYRTAIAVMRWAAANWGYESLTPKEAWDIEYWPLELYKLTLKPPPKELASHVAVITGGAGGIGRATAACLLGQGSTVILADIDEDHLSSVAAELGNRFGESVRTVCGDATSEDDVRGLFEEAVLAFGGVDIVIPNAGVGSAGPIDETALAEWDRVHAVLSRGYFLACRAAFTVFKQQGIGGSIVINSSKNGLAAGTNAIAYTTAKAAELHMTRCLAEEGGRFGIRVNAVAPDAVIQGSGFWNQQWRDERAKAYGFEVGEIEEHYRQRNALKVSILAEDVAQAILFLVSRRSAKTTGCVITVDGGLAIAYPR